MEPREAPEVIETEPQKLLIPLSPVLEVLPVPELPLVEGVVKVVPLMRGLEAQGRGARETHRRKNW